MREIKFRGLRTDGKGFIYGNLMEYGGEFYIVPQKYSDKPFGYFEVIPESVGQFTGLKDKNGVEIYEGSILQNPKNEIGIVVWSDAGLKLKCKRKNGDYFIIPLDQGFCNNKIIIGNIHENKDLLK